MTDGMSLQQLIQYDETASPYEKRTGHFYDGPIKFKGHEINALHSPNHFIRTLLKTNHRTGYTGVAVIAPPGHGKTTLGQMLMHLTHSYKVISGDNLTIPNFRVEWAGAWEFTHQDEYYKNLPKAPHLIVYDDISGSLEQMSEQQVNQCFEALTTVRHVLGEENNVIIFCLFHYTKILQKDFRAQLQYKIYLGMGDEEQTNIKHTYDKNSKAYKKLMSFARIYQAQMEGEGFWLPLTPNRKVFLTTDKPFRCACVVTLSWTEYLLFTKDSCEVCRKKESGKKIPAKEFITLVYDHYGKFGVQALKYKLYEKGYPTVLKKELFYALHFINRIFKEFSTDWDEMQDEILKRANEKRRIQKRFNIPRKAEDKLYRRVIADVKYGVSALVEIDEKITEGMLIFD